MSNAKQVMGRVKAPKKNATGRDIARAMVSEDYCHLPVVDEAGDLIGIVSEFDLLMAVKQGKNLEDVTAGELMVTKVITVTEDDSIEKVIEIMTTNYFITLPVVRGKKLVGLINRRKILHSIVDDEYRDYFMAIQ